MWTLTLTALVASIALGAQSTDTAPDATPFKTPDELSAWVTAYYLNPQPEHLGPALRMTLERYEEFGTGARPIMVGLAHAAARHAAAHHADEHPDQLERWCADLEALPNGPWFAAVIAWWTDSPQGRAIVQDIASRAEDPAAYQPLIDRPTTDLKTTPVTAPVVQDMLWACFFTTGDTDYIARFVPMLQAPPDDDRTPGWQQRLMLHGSARWSFTANAYQHPRVLEFARAHHADTDDPREKAALAEIIAAVEERIEAEGPPPTLGVAPPREPPAGNTPATAWPVPTPSR